MKYILLAIALFVTGCASNADIDNLQMQIDSIKPQLTQISKDASDAKKSAEKARALSEKIYEDFEKMNATLNANLDSLFKKAQHK